MMEPIAVVTGGAGFIGSHMVDLLRDRGYRVRVIDTLVGGRESNLARHAGDARVSVDRRDIRSIEPGAAIFQGADCVFHFAGIGVADPAAQTQLGGLAVHEPAKANALHAPADEEVEHHGSECIAYALLM